MKSEKGSASANARILYVPTVKRDIFEDIFGGLDYYKTSSSRGNRRARPGRPHLEAYEPKNYEFFLCLYLFSLSTI